MWPLCILRDASLRDAPQDEAELPSCPGSTRASTVSEATMSGLTFTEDAARHLARVYLTPDVVAQRAETMKQLALSPGERVLDVGCGPGFLCESIAAAVGPDGAVTGIDISSDLVALCKTRNPPKWLSYAVGDATQIAQPDASFDVGHVFGDLGADNDVDRVLAEAF